MTTQGNMIDIIFHFRNLCLQRYPEDIDVSSPEDRDNRLGLTVKSDDLSSLFRSETTYGPIEDICRLAKTPRLLKLILRRTYLIWERLHGEIDFDNILVANTLRFGAPEAFEFLLEHHGVIRGLQSERISNECDTRLKDVEMKWERVTEATIWDAASARNLSQFLFPSWRTCSNIRELGLLQFLQVDKPTDYLSRYLTEELVPDTIRDQELLLSIKAWKEDVHGSHFRGASLPETMCTADEEFASKFEYFAHVFLNGKDIRNLAAALFSQALDLHGVKADRDSIVVFIPLWRLALRQPIDESEHIEWVKNEIFKSLPISLCFSNVIYYYWSSNSEVDIHRTSHRIELRSQIVTYAQVLFENKPNDFIRVLNPHFMYSTFHFCIFHNDPKQGGAGFIASDWLWFSGLLLDAGEIDPQAIVPQIVCLLTDEQHHIDTSDFAFTYSFKKDFVHELFGGGMSRLMNILATEISVESFDLREQKRIQTAKEFALEWLRRAPHDMAELT